MIERFDVAIVGGGPAGSSCAWALRRAGAHVAVLDAAVFPRQKVCAGWLTPRVLTALSLDPGEYRASGLVLQEIRAFGTAVIGDARLVETTYGEIVSYAIRRVEFDDFLLRRAGARVLQQTRVTDIRRDGAEWVLNGRVAAPVLVGAGGHFCPVGRRFNTAPDDADVIVARELEAPLGGARCPAEGVKPELFFSRDLEGYGWCVRKGEYLNVGFGRRGARAFQTHVSEFAEWLRRRGLIPDAFGDWRKWPGHAYRLRRPGRCIAADGVVLIGDAAGLAWAESGEGIAPAIESGIAAARAIAGTSDRPSGPRVSGWQRYEEAFGDAGGGGAQSAFRVPTPLARALLRIPPVARFALDRWFLRRTADLAA